MHGEPNRSRPSYTGEPGATASGLASAWAKAPERASRRLWMNIDPQEIENELAAYKCPRSLDFERELPRLPTEKLYKRLLEDRYWGRGDSKIVQE